MSMINISGIPNLGIPAMGGFPQSNPSQGLNNAQASYAGNQAFFDRQANALAQANSYDPWANSPGGFGAQTAAYAGLGAAYGRGTGGFNAAGGVTQPVGGRGGSVFNTGAAPVPYPNSPGPGSFSPSPNYPGGSRGSSVFNTGAAPIPYPNSPGPGSFSPSPNYPGGMRSQIAQAMMPPAPNFNDTFSQFTRGNPTPTQMQNQPAIDQMLRFNGRGTGVEPYSVPPSSPPSPDELGTGGPTPGWNPGGALSGRFSGAPEGGAGSPGTFADRFAAGNYFQPGQPSEYATSPYTDVRGRTHQPGPTPPGVSTPYSFDNPGGALGRGGFRGTQAPIMGDSGWEPGESADTLTSRDRTAPGGFYGSAFDPGQFQPASGLGGRGFTSGTGTIGAPEGGFNSYGLPGGSGIGSFGGARGRLTTGVGTTGGSVSGEGSPFTSSSYTQPSGAPSWQTSIPPGRGLPAVTKSVYDAAGQHGYDPAALAGVIGVESGWNPRLTNEYGYSGMTQMGPGTFKDAGGRLGGMTFGEYKDAPAAKQIGAYGDWLNTGARQAGSGAGLVTGGIGGLPPPMQAAIMQATQFAPNATGWPARFARGDMTTPTTMTKQAEALRYGGQQTYPSINSMNSYFENTMSGWPTRQKWGPY